MGVQRRRPDLAQPAAGGERRRIAVPAQVTPFSRWERELPKLVGDDRYKAVGSQKDRKALFDEYCRTLAAEKAAGKKADKAPGGKAGGGTSAAAAAAAPAPAAAAAGAVGEDMPAADRKQRPRQSSTEADTAFRCPPGSRQDPQSS